MRSFMPIDSFVFKIKLFGPAKIFNCIWKKEAGGFADPKLKFSGPKTFEKRAPVQIIKNGFAGFSGPSRNWPLGPVCRRSRKIFGPGKP